MYSCLGLSKQVALEVKFDHVGQHGYPATTLLLTRWTACSNGFLVVTGKATPPYDGQDGK